MFFAHEMELSWDLQGDKRDLSKGSVGVLKPFWEALDICGRFIFELEGACPREV